MAAKKEKPETTLAAEAILEAIPDAFIVLDINGVILSVNSTFIKMFGYKPEERIGKSFNELTESLKAEDIERFMKLLGELIETGKVEPVETVIGTKDGKEVPISVTYSLIKDAEGNPKNIIAMLRDITELKRLQEKEKEVATITERASIIDAMVDGVLVHDLDGRIVSINKALEDMTGYKLEENVGKSFSEFLKPEDLKMVKAALLELSEKDKVGPIELIFSTKDGRDIPIQAINSLIKDAQGNPTYGVVVIRDITELKQTEEVLSEAKDYTDNIIKSMTDTLIAVDPDGKIQAINRAAEELLGYKGDELIGKPVATILEEEEEEFKGTRLKKLVEEGNIRHYDMNYRTKKGEVIPVSFSGSVMRDNDGKLMGIVGIARDTREIKHLQEELIQSVKMAAIGELASGIAHEIRNPLAIMAISAQYLQEKLTPYDPKREFTEVINKNIEAIDTIVKRMLDLARPSRLELLSININRLVDETSRLISGKASEQRVKIVRQYHRRLPRITVDERRLGEVFLNLMMNAVQAMPEGGYLRVSTNFHQEENVISIQFRDNGEGIPAGYQKKIFDPFFTTRKKGVGLGLSVSQRTINDHHGTVEVQSQIGKGTTFTIKLPISPA